MKKKIWILLLLLFILILCMIFIFKSQFRTLARMTWIDIKSIHQDVKIIDGIPYLNQFTLGYPTGCEAVSATMLLQFKGYDIKVEDIIENTPTQERGKYIYENQVYAGNPFKVFVGHPSKGKSEGSYGCFAEPIIIAMKKIAGDKVKNISGCDEETLFSYIDKGEPVVVWGIKNAGDIEEGVTWKYPDGSGSFKELIGEHCFVLIGHDEQLVYLDDPSAGRHVEQPKEKFIKNWKALYSQAIIVE